MVDRDTDEGGVRESSGRLSSDKDRPAEAASGLPDADADSAVDPELVSDLGEEFELRGDQLEAQLVAVREEAAEWRDKALRAQAEFENTRKRLEARHADALLRAGERVVEGLFPVIDDLERATAHAKETGGEAEGLEAVHRKILDVIGREGCTPVEALGQPFDPEKHHAVQMRDDDSVPDHTVVEVFQTGYEMHGRVIRPAMVVVSTGGAAIAD